MINCVIKGVIKGVIKDIDCYEEGGSKGEGRVEGFLLVYSLTILIAMKKEEGRRRRRRIF